MSTYDQSLAFDTQIESLLRRRTISFFCVAGSTTSHLAFVLGVAPDMFTDVRVEIPELPAYLQSTDVQYSSFPQLLYGAQQTSFVAAPLGMQRTKHTDLSIHVLVV